MAYYTDIVVDQFGVPKSGVSITPLDTSGNIAVVRDNNGNLLNLPLLTDANGVFSFNATDGVYRLEYRYGGRVAREDDVIVGVPPAFVGPAGPSANVLDALGTSTSSAASQRAVTDGLAGKASITGPFAGNANTASQLSASRLLASTGDVTWSVNFNGAGNVSGAATIAGKAVTNAKMADMAAGTIKGASTAGAPADLSPVAAKTILALDNVENKSAAQITTFDRGTTYPTGSLGLKASETISITDSPYNASPNAIFDSTAAFQAAIAAASVAGKAVHIPAGTWYISDVLNLTQTVRLTGEGRFASTIIQKTTSKGILNVSGNFCMIDQIGLLYSGTPVSGGTAIRSTGNYTTVDYVAVRSAYVSMDFETGVGSTASNILLFDYEDIGLYVRNLNDLFVSNFIFNAGNTVKGRRGGFRMEGKVEAFIMHNGDILLGVTSHTTNVTTYGMNTRPAYNNFTNVFFDSGKQSATFDRMVETEFVSCWWSGARETVSAGLTISECRSLRFTNCRFFNNGGHGVLVQPSCTDINFVNCKAESNSAAAANGAYHGFAFGAGCTQFSLIGCTASNGLFTGQQGVGVFIDSGCNDFNVESCNLLGNFTGPLIDGTGSTARKTIRANKGYTTQNKGTATIASGATSVVVTHGLSGTVQQQDVVLTRGGTNAGSTDLFADTFTASTFTIRTAAAPTAALPVVWQARIAGA